ncbi:MAG: hypothetical protein FJZ92_06985 [Chloroflexi bacterium]|nr:hypothetical protein [Chloroflexota bacterium]
MAERLDALRRDLRRLLIRACRALARAAASIPALAARARPRRRAPARPEPTADEEARASYATVVAGRDDDLASITGRVDTAADVNVVLVVPQAARGLREAGIWPHVAAHVRRRGITLAVVSARRDVRGYALENGLTAERSIARLFRPPRRRIVVADRELLLPQIAWRSVLINGTLVAIVVGGAGTACDAIPSAEIVIVPPSREFTTAAAVRLNPLASETDLRSGVVPARNLRVTIETIVSGEATGRAEVPDRRASVELTFTNNGARDIAVPPGTRVVDDSNTAFTTNAALIVPAGRTASVGATAVAAGPQGNVAARTLRHIEGVVGVSVTNPAAASGGSTRSVQAVAQTDLDRVRGVADAVLRRVGAREIGRAVEGGRVFTETLSVAVISETPVTPPGEPSGATLVEYRAVVAALVLTEEQLRQVADRMLRAALGPGVALLPETSTARVVGTPAVQGGVVSVELRATGRVADLFDAARVSEAVTGARPSVAARRLQEMLALPAAPRITIEPEPIPWQWLPRRADRISIVLAGAPPGDTAATSTPTATPAATRTPTPAPASAPGTR